MTRADRRLAVFFFIIGLLLLGWRAWGNPAQSSRVAVSIGGERIMEFALTSETSEKYQIQLDKGVAVLKVQDGAVRLEEMEGLCPREICSHTGWIKRQGESIVCVPNSLLVQIIKAEGDNVDALSR